MLNIGILSRQRGDYGYALEMLSEAGRIDQALGDERSARLVDLQLLPTCVALNLREESHAAAERAIAGLRRFEMPLELGQALLAAAALAELDDELEQAGTYIDEARACHHIGEFTRFGKTKSAGCIGISRGLRDVLVHDPAD
jgi:hypothetical protein